MSICNKTYSAKLSSLSLPHHQEVMSSLVCFPLVQYIEHLIIKICNLLKFSKTSFKLQEIKTSKATCLITLALRVLG